MYLQLDHHSGEPIYRQIVEQLKYKIACGQLQAGDQLPSIRALAGELKINTRTVVKAYESLVQDQLAVMQHGRGVFVAQSSPKLTAAQRRRELKPLVRRMLAEASRLGADPQQIIEIVREEAKHLEAES